MMLLRTATAHFAEVDGEDMPLMHHFRMPLSYLALCLNGSFLLIAPPVARTWSLLETAGLQIFTHIRRRV